MKHGNNYEDGNRSEWDYGSFIAEEQSLVARHWTAEKLERPRRKGAKTVSGFHWEKSHLIWNFAKMWMQTRWMVNDRAGREGCKPVNSKPRPSKVISYVSSWYKWATRKLLVSFVSDTQVSGTYLCDHREIESSSHRSSYVIKCINRNNANWCEHRTSGLPACEEAVNDCCCWLDWCYDTQTY